MQNEDKSEGQYEGVSFLARGNYELNYPKDKTALLVIDPVNDFLSEGGAAWELTKGTLKLHDVVGNLKKVIEGARARGIPVIYGPMAFTEEDYKSKELHRLSGISRIMYERKMFLAGSWGADFHPELTPQEGDIVLLPHKVTDVFQTDLPDHLNKLGTTHLVIAGMAANLCCDSTGRHAAEAGYDVTYLYDAIGSESIPSYEASVMLNYPLTGNAVIKVEEFLEALDNASVSDLQIKAGEKVYGSDNMEIGEISEFVQAKENHETYLLIKKGIIFTNDIFIPMDAVVKKTGSRVLINVPKLVVPKMPWNEAPTREIRLDKQGEPASSISKMYRSQSPSINSDLL
ncbi:MAG: isochorismatase family protein [Bdellovibrionales bacterium]|nr:isochorismatase family protein [Bdellovibrionales bacterium]